MIAATVTPARAGWLRSLRFDISFIVGIAAIALVSGCVVTQQPRLLVPVIVVDLWILGYHHVISTFTRLCFTKESRARYRFLLFGLPPLVLAATLSLGLTLGPAALFTIYLYWQWFHYTRQSYGIAQAYRRAAGGTVTAPSWLLSGVVYIPPVWGILNRSHQTPATFLGSELWVLPVPEAAVTLGAAASAAFALVWVGHCALALIRGTLPVAHTLYLLSHLCIFYVGYVAIADITAGWVVVNIWHNAQYVLFVWLHHNRRYEGKRDDAARFLSAISQRRHLIWYFVICLSVSTLFYAAIQTGFWAFQLSGIVVAAIVYQTINFHHYIVDAVIWRRPRAART